MNRNDFNPELCSIARGVETADAVLWQAKVELLFASPVQPGKYVLLFTGSVQDVTSAVRRGAEVAGPDLVDELVIQQVHEQVEEALRRRGGHIDGHLDAIGVVETSTVASAIIAADVALKTTTIDLFDLRCRFLWHLECVG